MAIVAYTPVPVSLASPALADVTKDFLFTPHIGCALKFIGLPSRFFHSLYDLCPFWICSACGQGSSHIILIHKRMGKYRSERSNATFGRAVHIANITCNNLPKSQINRLHSPAHSEFSCSCCC